jgi:hypothetical protein
MSIRVRLSSSTTRTGICANGRGVVDIETPVVARFGLADVGSLGVAAALPGNLTGGEEGSVIGGGGGSRWIP